jgi:glycosyltransferase 2 family protein
MGSSNYILSAERHIKPVFAFLSWLGGRLASVKEGLGGLKKHHLGVIFGIVAAMALAGFVVHRWRTSGFAWREFLRALGRVDWNWLGLALALVLATYVGRALRWEVMLRPLAKNSSLLRVLVATCIGFTAVVLFGRAGEPVRPYLISRKEGVSFASQMAAWVVERILDLLMVLVIFGIALTQVSHSAIQPSPKVETTLEAGGAFAGLTGVACLALLLGLRQFRGQVQQRILAGLSFLPPALRQRIDRFFQAFGEGMQSTRSGSFTFRLIAYTIIEWAIIAGAFFCVFRAFPATAALHFTDIVIILGFVCFGSVLQIPGVGGGMQIVTVLVLTEFYGVGLEAASGVALILWIVSFVVIVPIGLALAFHEGIKWRSLKHIAPESST